VDQFYQILRLQQINFTRSCLCCITILLDINFCSAPILPDIALAMDQFYQMLLLLYPHFTGYYIHSALILPDIVLAADQFYQMLLLLRHNFTS
jgi:hypothetical protein